MAAQLVKLQAVLAYVEEYMEGNAKEIMISNLESAITILQDKIREQG